MGWQVSHSVNITNMSLDQLVARAVYNVHSGWCCVNKSDRFPMLTEKLPLLKQPHGHSPAEVVHAHGGLLLLVSSSNVKPIVLPGLSLTEPVKGALYPYGALDHGR